MLLFIIDSIANWPAVLRNRYLARQVLLSIVAHEFIECYGESIERT